MCHSDNNTVSLHQYLSAHYLTVRIPATKTPTIATLGRRHGRNMPTKTVGTMTTAATPVPAQADEHISGINGRHADKVDVSNTATAEHRELQNTQGMAQHRHTHMAISTTSTQDKAATTSPATKDGTAPASETADAVDLSIVTTSVSSCRTRFDLLVSPQSPCLTATEKKMANKRALCNSPSYYSMDVAEPVQEHVASAHGSTTASDSAPASAQSLSTITPTEKTVGQGWTGLAMDDVANAAYAELAVSRSETNGQWCHAADTT